MSATVGAQGGLVSGGQMPGHGLANRRSSMNLQLRDDVAVNVIIYMAVKGSSGGSLAEWLACWTQAQKGPGSNHSRDAVG